MKRQPITTWLLILGAAFCSMAFDTDDDEIHFYLNTYRTFTPGSDVIVSVNGRFHSSVELDFELYRINDPVDFFNEQQNPHSPGTEYDAEKSEYTSTIDLKDRSRFRSVSDWSKEIRSKRYWTQEEINVPVQEAGVYLLVARAAKQKKMATTVVVVTEAGLVVKQADDMMLAWSVNLTNGRRMPNGRIVFRKQGGMIERSTDRNGLATIETAELDAVVDDEEEDIGFGRGYYGGQNILYGEADGSFFISDSYFYSHWRQGSAESRLYLYTERPVYRPNQAVYYRGMLRDIERDGTYADPSADQVVVTVHDSRGDEVAVDTLDVDDFGTFRGSLTLADEPPLGNYTISVMADGIHIGNGSFAVEEYKKPEYEVVVTTAEQSYSSSDKVEATVQADYYFGSPVTDAAIEYRITRSRYWIPWWMGSRWAYLYSSMPAYSGYQQQYVDRGTGTINDDGSFTFSFDTPKDLDQDYNYYVTALVTDASRRTISGSTQILVTRGAFYLTGRTENYVYEPETSIDLLVEARRFGSNDGVATDVEVEVERRWWDRDLDRGSRSEPAWSGSGRTGSDGNGRITFRAEKPGYYTATFTATDAKGKKITASRSIYVAEPGYSWGPIAGDGVQIIPDRDLYKPGETITALVVMPHGDVDALVSVEGPTILNHSVERLSGNSAIVRIPVEEKYAPTIHIAASTLIGDRFYNATKEVLVAPDEKILTIEIETDREEYRPGDAGTVTLRAVDSDERPVPNVDLAVGLVDEAIYAIRPESTQPITEAFYGMRWNQVNTSSSLSFRFWSQSLEEVESAAEADDAGAQLSLNRSVPSDAMLVDQESKAAPPGADPGSLIEPALRQDFRDLMHWSGSVRTDSRGRATIPVDFPDNLTTWRITARGITRATQVGEATAKVIARKNLLVRMETPRFMTEGDDLLIATIVHNYLDTEKDVTLEFGVEGASQKESRRSVTIPANGETRVDWAIEADELGVATMTIRALTDEESDAMQMKVPVMPRGVLTGTSAIATIDNDGGTETMSLLLPKDGRIETANLVVALSPSAASSMMGALDDLIGYPYGCVEQTMSRFLPTVVVAEVLDELDVPFDQAKREELPKMVEQGLKRLRTLQHDDGGWGWWEHDETNPFMTAYVMYGLTIAADAGYPVDMNRYGRGRESLYGMIESRTAGGSIGSQDSRLSRTTEAYMLYVASIVKDRGDENEMVRDRIDELAGDLGDLNPYGIALLAQAAHAQDQASIASKLAGKLRSDAQQTATGAYWSGSTWKYNWQEDKVETSAAVVKALLAIDGDTPLVQKGVRWLLGQKQGRSWYNTRQTAMVIYALADYMLASNELDPDYRMTVTVNGTEVLTKRITRDDVFKEETTVEIGPEVLRDGNNDIRITKSGSGRLYGSSRLTYYAVGDAIRPGNAGFAVERTYYRLERIKKKEGYAYRTRKLQAQSEIKSGDEIFVRLTVNPESSQEYVMVEDPLPAGFEVVRETNAYWIEGEAGYGRPDRGGYYRYSPWSYWYADRDIRDEKITFFATRMPAGKREMTYIMRAQIPGTVDVMPAVASLMYYPEVRGNSAMTTVTTVDR